MLAISALLLGAWAAAEFRAATLGRPWFVAPTALAVAPDGTIFVAANGDEIQVYGADGAPERAWRLERGGVHRLHLEGDRLSVVYTDGDRVDAFTRDGAPLGERRGPGAAAPGGESALADGPVALRAEGIVRTAPPPIEVLVPLPPWPLSLFGARPLLPITLVLLAAPGALAACMALLRARPPLRQAGASPT